MCIRDRGKIRSNHYQIEYFDTVSYTHLDVYKRQAYRKRAQTMATITAINHVAVIFPLLQDTENQNNMHRISNF